MGLLGDLGLMIEDELGKQRLNSECNICRALVSIMHMLHAEFLVAEQAKLYARAQGLTGIRYSTSVDFTYRVLTKGVMRVYDTIMINMLERYFAPKRQQLAISLQMGDERVVAHMD